ncbi:MAG TPA: BamA/TamA family outer membrane protein [Gemmatimonadales bacterium]|nr:BamA/TamA family outer membrane protein [Gemmatimonadales bacterium]
MRAPYLTAGFLMALTGGLRAQTPDGADSSPPPPYRNRLLVVPYVSYTPQTRVQFGIGGGYQFKWPGAGRDTATRSSYVAENVTYTTRGQWTTTVAGSVYSPRNRWWAGLTVSLGYFPVFYYGIGPTTTAADTNLMQAHFILTDAMVLRAVRGALSAGLHYRLSSYSSIEWQFPARISPTLPGGRGGVSSGIGATLQLDTRNSITTPTRGRYVLVDALTYPGMLGGDFGYSSLTLDARAYLPIRHARDVIAVAAFAQFNSPDVPIQSMAMLGGDVTQLLMRGIYLGRFRDRHETVLQVDYRGHLAGRFGYVVFGATGNVFGSPGHGPFDEWKATYGAGLRFNVNPADPLNVRVDYTLSSFGSSGLSLGATEAF